MWKILTEISILIAHIIQSAGEHVGLVVGSHGVVSSDGAVEHVESVEGSHAVISSDGAVAESVESVVAGIKINAASIPSETKRANT